MLSGCSAPGYSGIRLHPLERRLGPHALDLELRHEDGKVARGGDDERDGTLGDEEVEVRQVPDVVRIEKHEPGQLVALDALQQASASLRELRGRDAGQSLHCWAPDEFGTGLR